MQELAIAGAASGCPKNTTNQFAFKLTGADVMCWKPKSLLQQLVDYLRSKGLP